MKNKFTIGIPLIDNYSPYTGGGYSYYSKIIKNIDQFDFDKTLNFVFISFDNRVHKSDFKKECLALNTNNYLNISGRISRFFVSLLYKIADGSLLYKKANEAYNNARNRIIIARLNTHNIDVLYHVNPDGGDLDFPFVTTHWDVGHLSTFAFPEFAGSHTFSDRNDYYLNKLPKALAILTESATGKEELVKYSNLNEQRIFTVPLFPGPVVEEEISAEESLQVIELYNLKSKKFLFYPAHFSPHKNHITLLDAFEKTVAAHPDIKVVFSGSNVGGNLEYIKSYIEELKLGSRVVFTGYITNKDLKALYLHAAAMVMPTFLGPSNMPPLEAAFIGCPCLISDFMGHHELLGDYATYFDPRDYNDLAKKIEELLDGKLPSNAFKNSKQFSVETTMKALEESFLRIFPLRKTWHR